jgi:hypothetical protein
VNRKDEKKLWPSPQPIPAWTVEFRVFEASILLREHNNK